MYLVLLMYLVSLVNEVTFGPHLRTGAGCLENQQLIRALELAVPPLTLLREEKGEVESLTNGRFHQSCLCREATMKTQKDGVHRAPGLVTRGDLGRLARLARTWRLCALCISSTCLCLSYILS